MKYIVIMRNNKGESYRAYVYANDADTAITFAKAYAATQGQGGGWTYITAKRPNELWK